jgi:hypothetical protein
VTKKLTPGIPEFTYIFSLRSKIPGIPEFTYIFSLRSKISGILEFSYNKKYDNIVTRNSE